ncbi:MAG: hypothetical protein ABJ205_12085 [Erythrobacter sp.]|uniref:hypothetical protein n=1 Tax=Erythrobacter sp. TaxID=1042 RepID=UPI0032673660
MTALMLLGMHRSYTSLVSRWLLDCGMNMGQEFLPEGVGNSDGHFEDIDFFDLHRAALRQAQLPDNGMVDLSSPHFDEAGYDKLAFSGSILDRATELTVRRKNSRLPFGWKEPRTCLFLPFYEKALDPFSIVLFRPYQEVVSSLVAREPKAIREFGYPGWKRPAYWVKKRTIEKRCFDLRHGFLEAWIHYNTKLLEHIHRVGAERVLVHDLNSIAEDPFAVTSKLREWGFAVEDRPLGALIKPLSDRDNLRFESSLIGRAQEVTKQFDDIILQG